MKKTIVKVGLAAKFNDKYWGIQDQDDGFPKYTKYGYGDICNARIVDVDYTEPTSMTWKPEFEGPYIRINPLYDELLKAKFVRIRKTTIYEEF